MSKIYLVLVPILLVGLGIPCSFAEFRLKPEQIRADLQEVYQRAKKIKSGKNADYIPALASVNPEYLGITVVTTNGGVISEGDFDKEFAIESIAKPFLYALALRDQGEAVLSKKMTLNGSAFAFNSITALEILPGHLQNPLVNAGAIQNASFVKGANKAEKWNEIVEFFKKLAGTPIKMSETVFKSEMESNYRNRAIANLLQSYQLLGGSVEESLENYTRACSLMVNTRSLGMIGAVLAGFGKKPDTHSTLLNHREARTLLSQMVVEGLYEESGKWLTHVGLPAKSGVGGGILAVAPGKLAIAVFSPRLDQAGNSVRGTFVIQALAEKWGLHILDQQGS